MVLYFKHSVQALSWFPTALSFRCGTSLLRSPFTSFIQALRIIWNKQISKTTVKNSWLGDMLLSLHCIFGGLGMTFINQWEKQDSDPPQGLISADTLGDQVFAFSPRSQSLDNTV